MTIRVGDVLANRFSLIRLLGTGGMGQVFEAKDRLLNDRVAVKVVGSHQMESDEGLLRLRREVQMARRVTHRNVCRIYDLVQHQFHPDGPFIDLVSMELLEGETLRDLCNREAPLSMAVALPIVRQLARGLLTAHQCGIVHRDLKPSNVMLVPEEGGLRATITDFGLARHMDPDKHSDPFLTEAGALVGTPAYLAPEQAASEPTSAATDIYSLGTMLYEMLSGRLPYQADSPWQMVVLRLTESPKPLIELRPDLPAQIYTLVERCLRRDPTERIQTAGMFLGLLDREDPSWNLYGHKQRDLETSKIVSIKEIADWLGSGESDSADGSSAVPDQSASAETQAVNLPPRQITTAPPTESHSALDSRPIPDSKLDPESKPGPDSDRQQVAKPWLWLAPAAAVLIAVLWLGPGRGWTQTALDDSPVNGNELIETIGSSASIAKDPEPDLSDLPALRLPNTEAPPKSLSGHQCDDTLAKVDTLLASYQGARAVELLDAELKHVPGDPWLITLRAKAQWRAGREDEARQSIAEAYKHRDSLPRREQLIVQGIHQGFMGDWGAARDTFKNLWIKNPDNLAHGLRILEAHWHTGEVDKMPEIFASLRQLGGDDSDDPRIDLWQGWLSSRNAEHEAAERYAQSLIKKAQKQGKKMLELEAQMLLVKSHRALGHGLEYRQAVARLWQLAEQVGDPYYLAQAHRYKSHFFDRLGRHDESLRRIDAADQGFHDLGSRRGLCLASEQYGLLENWPVTERIERLKKGLTACQDGGFKHFEALTRYHLAMAWRERGNFSQAAGLFQESARQLESLGNSHKVAMTRIGFAFLLQQMGRIDDMLHTLGEAQAWFDEYPDTEKQQIILIASSEAALLAGKTDKALDFLRQAGKLKPVGTRLLDLQWAKCKIAYAVGDPERLQQAVEELGRLARSTVDEDWLSNAQKFEALLLVLKGRPKEGLDHLANLDDEAFDRVRVRLLLDLGLIDAARRVMDRVSPSIHQSAIWADQIHQAWIDSRTNLPAAMLQLQKVEKDCQEKGHYLLSLESRLVRGRLARDANILKSVSQQAQQLGLLRLSREADEAGRQLNGTSASLLRRSRRRST